MGFGELASEFVHTEYDYGYLNTRYHRMVESFMLEKTLRGSLSPTITLTLPSPPLNPPQSATSMVF